MNWHIQTAPKPSDRNRTNAEQRQQQLTKPPGSLGRLEQLAITLAELQGTDMPACDRVAIDIFAADHGIAEAGVDNCD